MKLCLVGPSAAGKTTVGQYLKAKHGFVYVEASDYVRTRYAASLRSEVLIDYVDREFRIRGKDTFARDLFVDPIVRDIGQRDLVISGFRAFEECASAQERFVGVRVIGLYANSATRYSRWLIRETKTPKDFPYPQFVQKDMREYSFGIARLLAEGCETLYLNDGSIEDLHKWCDEAIVR